MNAMTRLGSLGADNWDSLAAAPSDEGYSFVETDGAFRHSSRNETLLRFVGLTFVMGSLIQWSLPNASFAGDPMSTKTFLAISFSLVGMALYHFATRGQRSEIRVDRDKGEIVLSALNRQDRQKGSRRIPLSTIKSIYVRRSDGAHGQAALRIRLMQGGNEINALRGDHNEISLVHGILCREIRAANMAR